MNTILQLAAPPVLGAFIGYMTNYVAIKMLFRPLRPWKIFGLRVPMTPGVIPSKRHMLAENIGEMVGEHLLTSSDMSRAINGQNFQQELRNLITNRVDELLQKDLGPVASVIPKRFKAYFRASIKILRLRFISSLHGYLDSESFAETMRDTVSKHLREFSSQDMYSFFSEERQEHFYSFLEKTISDVLSGPAAKQWIALQIQQKIDSILEENQSLEDLIPSELSSMILEKLEQEAPALIDKFARLLEEPAMREKITKTICRAITSFTNSLGPIASMMSSFISADSIEKKVHAYLSEKGGDIGKWLSDEAVQREVARLLREKASDFLQTPISSLTKNISPEKMQELNQDFSSKLTDFLAKKSTAKSLTEMLRTMLSCQLQKPIQDIFSDLFGPDALEKGEQWTAAEITAIVRSSRTKHLIDSMVVELFERKLLAKPIGPVAALLPKAVQQSLVDFILQQGNNLLVKEVPGLVESLNIKRMVRRKVDGLDLMRLETLLMSIMEEQFKYINLFGALLGFIIGLLNLALLQM